MGKQFLIWFAAALVGGLLLLTIGSYLRYGGPPPNLAHAWFGTPMPLDSAQAQQALAATQPPPPNGMTALKQGDQVPAALTLPGLDGKPHRMADYRGKPLLINFWATWCHPCRAEMPLLAATQKAHADTLQIIGIAMDDPAAIRKYLAQTPVDYPIMLGLKIHTDIAARFGDTAGLLPYSVLIGANGRIDATHLGKLDAQRLQQWLAQVQPDKT